MQAGAHVNVFGVGGTRLEQGGAELIAFPPGDIDASLRAWAKELPPDTRDQRTVLIVRDGELTGDTSAFVARALKLDAAGSGILSLPRGANARGLAALGIEPVGIEDLRGSTGLVLFGVDVERVWPGRSAGELLTGADWVCAIDQFPREWHELVSMVLPATAPLEKEGALVNLEGRLQRLAPTAPLPTEAMRGELSWLTGLARRLGAKLPAYAAGVYRLLAAGPAGQRLPVASYADLDGSGVRGVTGAVSARPAQPVTTDAQGRELSVLVAPSLYDAQDVRHAPAMSFLLPKAIVGVSPVDAERLELERGQDAKLQIGGYRVPVTVAFNRRITPGHARIQSGAAGLPAGLEGWHTATLDSPVAARASTGDGEVSDAPLSMDSMLGMDDDA